MPLMPLYRIIIAVRFSRENLFSIVDAAGKNDNDAARNEGQQQRETHCRKAELVPDLTLDHCQRT